MYTPKFTLSPESRARSAERDRRDGTLLTRPHETGRCGPLGTLCGGCYRDQYRELLVWAERQPPPEEGEDIVVYWRRIGGPFLDAWHDVASTIRRRAAAAETGTEVRVEVAAPGSGENRQG